jgi:hypothetical protein
MRWWLCLVVACAAPKPPLTLTYLGVAGWQIESGSATIVTDPYFTRPDFAKPIVSDPVAVAAHAPKHADAIVIGHSHVDHLLDAPPLALATHAQLIGSETTIRYAKAAGVPDDQLVSIQGGEDYDFGTFSIRVIASLHSALDHKHAQPPLAFDGFAEGGTFAYLLRVAGRRSSCSTLRTSSSASSKVSIPTSRSSLPDYAARSTTTRAGCSTCSAIHRSSMRLTSTIGKARRSTQRPTTISTLSRSM